MAYRRRYKRRRITKRRKSGYKRRKYSRYTRRFSRIPRVRGYGGYRWKGKSIMSGVAMSPPVIHNTGKGDGIVLRHREFIGNLSLTSSSLFRIAMSIDLNPGNPKFLWLKSVAPNWKEYEWHGMLVEYKPLTALATTSGAGQMGSIMIGTHYDMYERPYKNKIEMLNAEFTTSGKPQLAQLHPIETKRSATPVSRKWVRSPTDTSATADARLYDHGRVEIAVEGIPGASSDVIGEVWITYEVCLYKPKLTQGIAYNVEQDVESFYMKNVDTTSSGAGYFWKDTLGLNVSRPHIDDCSSMTGIFTPGGEFGAAWPTYRFNPLEVQAGDLFRFQVRAFSGDGTQTTLAMSSDSFLGTFCERFPWFKGNPYGDATGFVEIAAPENTLAAKYIEREYYVRIQPGYSIGNPPKVQLKTVVTTATGSSTVEWFLLVHKLKNIPGEPLDTDPFDTIHDDPAGTAI